MEIQKYVLNQVPVTLIKTSKFKTTVVEMMFLGSFSKANATKHSLLLRLLRASTKRYPTKKALTNRLFELYDASVAIHSLPSFATNVTFVSMELINDQYASKDSSLLEAGINLLAEILFNPNLDGSRWNQHAFLF